MTSSVIKDIVIDFLVEIIVIFFIVVLSLVAE